MTERLREATLSRLPASVDWPSYHRHQLKSGVVHIGVGAFHRAHQAPAFETLIAAGDIRWGIAGASLRSPAVREALQPQDFLYSLVVEDGQERRTKVIGALSDVIVASGGSGGLVDALASPEAHVVTITVTEKGYKLYPASGTLLEDDPEVRSDLASLAAPVTLPGYLTAALRLRKERGLHPLTILSCDNMAANGRKLQSSVIEVARAHDVALAEWISEHCTFPNTMVDRIVPATSEADIAATVVDLGLIDRATVRTESFSQWVIEDRFAGLRPELERAGVQFTSDVAPWERAKLRMLNGAHSTMAYLGGLAGIGTVDQFAAQRWGRALVDMLWDEVQPTLRAAGELDLPHYREQLMRRFGNAALNHRLIQIAMDGSQKIPQRLAAPAVEILERGHFPDAIALAIAAWMRWQEGRTDNGEPMTVDDPLASTTGRLISGASDVGDQVSALLSISSIFPERLSGDEAFRRRVTEHLASLQRIGAEATVRQFVDSRAALASPRKCA